MIEITINTNQANRRFDRFLSAYLPQAPKSLIYKWLRKKRIKLNGAKALGNETTAEGDRVVFYLAQETLDSFSAENAECGAKKEKKEKKDILRNWGPVDIIYEDENILLTNKPSGLLTHSNRPGSQDTLVDRLAYYLSKNSVNKNSVNEVPSTFAVCNRLDRNTSGLVVCGKNMAALQAMAAIFSQKKVDKTYMAVVQGRLEGHEVLTGYLRKDTEANQSYVYDNPQEGAVFVQTEYESCGHFLNSLDSSTLLSSTLIKVKLHTGKPHQIRAHLASIGHPLLGDTKYGGKVIQKSQGANKSSKSQNFQKSQKLRRGQMLHCLSLRFLEIDTGPLTYLSGKEWQAPLPEDFGL